MEGFCSFAGFCTSYSVSFLITGLLTALTSGIAVGFEFCYECFFRVAYTIEATFGLGSVVASAVLTFGSAIACYLSSSMAIFFLATCGFAVILGTGSAKG